MAHFGQRELACLISPENLASIRVANKCGFTERYRTVYKNEATIVLMFDPLQAGRQHGNGIDENQQLDDPSQVSCLKKE